MKNEILQDAIGKIDDELIEKADAVPKKNSGLIKWASATAAVCAAALICVFGILPSLKKNGIISDTPPDSRPVADGTPTESPAANKGESGEKAEPQGETAAYQYYKYAVDSGKYAGYSMGKAINASKIGQKLDDVTVTAGWIYTNGGTFWAANEHAEAVIYEIIGVSDDVAVAIRFIGELEAESTDLFYVIINPDSDSSAVSAYVIEQTDPFNRDSEE